jgi:hypothetical protein
MIAEALIANQTNKIKFVLVDAAYTEVAGLGTGWTAEVSKAGGAFVAGAGAKGETSDGWYEYTLTAAECDTIGPLAVKITHASIIQQNLEYVVYTRTAGCIEYQYNVTDSGTGNPIAGVEVWFTTDVAGNNVVWYGVTDAFGDARGAGGNHPCLDAGTYYVWKQRVGYVDDQNPDTEVVS